MYRNPDDFSEYGDTSHGIDYSDPIYYQPEARDFPSAQPVQSLDQYGTYSDYYDYASIAPGFQYDTPSQMQEYSGPASMNGYTTDVGAEQREAAKHGSADGARKRKGLAGLGGLVTTIGALLLKLKGFVLLLKFGPALLSAVVSVAIYSIFLGWPFAVGLVLLLFLHEMGHALVMKLKGIPVGGMIFIPMLGAAVMMRRMPQNAKDEAEVGIAGPIAGAIASSVCLAIAEMVPHTQYGMTIGQAVSPLYTVWAPLAYFGFFMNLFNLVPIVPFDGGRVLAAIDRRVWILGFAALLGYQIWLWLHGDFSIWLLFFVVMAATQLWSRNNDQNTAEAKGYYNVPVSTRIVLGLAYFGLAAVLVLGMSISHSLILTLQ